MNVSPATLHDIARLAGVSSASVSRALNGRPGVSAATRAAIARIAKEHNFIGNDSARALSSGKTGRVAVTLPEVNAEYFARILAGAAEVFRREGFSLILEYTHHRADAQEDALRRILHLGVDGALLLLPTENPQELQALHDTGFPFVVIDALDQLTLASPWITSTNSLGAQQATAHLLELGHRRVAIITGAPDDLASRERLSGVRQAMKTAGLALDERLVRAGTFTDPDSGFEAALELLSAPDRPTAIFAFNDDLAFGALRAIHQLGLVVPQHVSVVGFDDLRAASLVSPALTTVRQHLTEMGSTAADILVQRIAGVNPPGMQIQLSTELIVRGSTAPPAPDHK